MSLRYQNKWVVGAVFFFIYGETKIRQLELLRAPQIRVVPRAPPLGYSPLWDLVCLDATSFAPITFHSPAYSS